MTMKEQQKIKDTELGAWMLKKAPKVLDVVGHMLPDRGMLGVVKNLLHNEPNVDNSEADAKVDAEVALQEQVTKRWEADMSSDLKLAKLIRPITLISLLGMFMLTMVFDSLDNLAFNVKDSYVSLLEILMLTSFGAYFAGRTIEKSRK
jgi:hypothetical protein